MNWDRIEGNWKQLKGNVKQQWAKLTDDDLDLVNGKREELAGKIQAAYGLTKDEAEKQLDSWQNSQTDSDDELVDETLHSNKSTQTNKYGHDDSSNTPRNMQDGKADSSSNGPGDGAGVPGGDESDDMDDDYNNPSPNPMPDDLDEPTHAKGDETPHEDKSIDQT